MLLPRSSRSWHRGKPGIVLQFLALLLCLLILQTRLAYSPLKGDHESIAGAARLQSPLLNEQAAFWRDLYLIIKNNDPQCEHPPEAVVPHRMDISFDPSHNHPRPDVLWVEAADIKRMRDTHSNFVNDMQRSPPQIVYDPGSRGIAMTAGYDQLPVLVTSIRMLRRTSSHLPVEVFLADISDYDDEICDNVLPALNAKCFLLSDVFRAARSPVSINHFQYKVMAVLFSSFEEVLILDSDAFPLHDPSPLFDRDPFKDTGLVVWPDFWYASESPYYFEVAQIDTIPSLQKRASIESGEIIYSKSKHPRSIMLATYYNFWGPTYYYPLLSQGAPGQGDKETFAWAATALNEPFYAVHKPVMAVGRLDSNGKWLGSAMVQHDPTADAEACKPGFRDSGHEVTLGTADPSSQDAAASVKPFFIHANFPKFDPSSIFALSDDIAGHGGPTRDSDGTSVRCWMDQDQAIEVFGFDVEYRFWEEIRSTACEHEQQFGCWRGKQGICKRVTKYWYDVFEPRPQKKQEASL